MKRKIALLLALVMVLSLVPMMAFASSATFTRTTGEQIFDRNGGTSAGKVFARIKGEIPANSMNQNGAGGAETFFVKLSKGVEANLTVATNVYKDNDPSKALLYTVNAVPVTANKEWRVTVTPVDYSEKGEMFLEFDNLTLSNVGGEFTADFSAQTNTIFPTTASVVIGKTTTGTVDVSIMDVNTITDARAANEIGAIRFNEDLDGAFGNNNIKIKLPKGFYWDKSSVSPVNYRWGDIGTVTLGDADPIDGNYQSITLNRATASTEASNFEVTGLRILVDPSLAKHGEIEASISGGTTTSVTPSKLVVGVYGDYDVTVKALTEPQLLAGKTGQKIGKFEITEGIGGSIRPARTVTLTLPEGAKWMKNNDGDDIRPELVVADSKNYANLNFQGLTWSIVDAEGRTLRATLGATATDASDPVTATFQNGKVALEPNFEGELEVKVGGSAGITGEIVVGKVTSPVTGTVATIAPVKLGVQNQAIDDIIITEAKSGAMSRNRTLTINAPFGVRFATTPTATVVEGDALIERVWASADQQSINIRIVADSDEVTSVKVSGLALTLDRIAAEGPLRLELAGDSILNVNVPTAAPQSNTYFRNANVSSTVVVADVVTPHDGSVAVKEVVLTIGSTTMYVDGVATTANAAPYIDAANRTMLPLKAIGAVLGADVDWNEATRTVLVTKGTNRVLLTIDSDVMNVNGMQIPMRSKAVINNSRTFVPLKDLGVALGVNVEWDAATQTVTVK